MKASKGLRWWQAALVAILALTCYVQTAGYDLVWDDNLQIRNNDRIRSFANSGLAFKEQFWAFHGKWHYYRPLQTVSYMIGYALGGVSPEPYHWLNIILHILTSLAGLWFGWELFRNARIALWGGLLFAAHPMHTESVAWSGAITDLGCALFYFIALASWLRSREGNRRWAWLATSAVAFLMALLFKEMAATLPVLAIALDLLQERKAGSFSWRNRVRRWLPLALASGSYLILRLNALGAFAPTAKPLPINPVDFVLTAVYFTALYLTKLLLPMYHNAYRVFVPFSQLPPIAWVPPILLLIICAWLAWKYLRQDMRLVFLACWTIFTLAPVMNLGSVGKNVFCERYLYIPSLGFCLLLAAMAELRSKEPLRRRMPIICAVIVSILGALTIQRNPVWRDDKTLLTVTLGISPDAIKMHQDLGISHLQKGNLEAALREFETALKTEEQIFIRSPENRYDALIGIGTVHIQEGRLEQAWIIASEARDLDPKRGDAYRILGTIRSTQERDVEAEELLSKCVALNPTDTVAQVNLGSVLLFRKKPSAAEVHFRKALDQEPRSIPAHLGLAISLGQLDRQSEALTLVREVLAIDPGNQDALRILKQLSF